MAEDNGNKNLNDPQKIGLRLSCSTTFLCPPMDNSRSGSSIQSCGFVRLQPGWAHVNCFAGGQSLHSTLCSLCSLLATNRRHDNFFTPNTFFPRAVCGLWCWSLSRHAADRGTAGKSVNDVSSFWRGKMPSNIFCVLRAGVYQPRRIVVLQVTGSFSQVSKVRGNKSFSYRYK